MVMEEYKLDVLFHLMKTLIWVIGPLLVMSVFWPVWRRVNSANDRGIKGRFVALLLAAISIGVIIGTVDRVSVAAFNDAVHTYANASYVDPGARYTAHLHKLMQQPDFRPNDLLEEIRKEFRELAELYIDRYP